MSEFGSVRYVDERHIVPTIKLSRVTRHSQVYPVVPARVERLLCPGIERQRNFGGIYQSSRGNQQAHVEPHDYNIRDLSRVRNSFNSKIFSREVKYPCRSIVKIDVPLRMATSPKTVSSIGTNVGSAYSRQICIGNDNTVKQVQLPVFRSRDRSCRFNDAIMEKRKQFCEPTILDVTKNSEENPRGKSDGNSDCATLACANVVRKTSKDVNKCTTKVTKFSKNNVKKKRNSRTNEKCKMENVCLESVWEQKLIEKQWSELAIKRFLTFLAPTTWLTYNRYFAKFCKFGIERGVNPVEKPVKVSQSLVVDFFIDVAEGSRRPKAILNTSMAAIANYYKAVDRVSPVNNDVVKLVEGLVKSGTVEPMRRTPVLPVAPFLELFRKWGDNEDLSLWSLRLKTLTLLSITAMMRPSDMAPRSGNWNGEVMVSNQFKRTWIDFSNPMYVQLYFFGIKNDYQRDGFCVNIPYASEIDVCPVRALKVYLDRTKSKVAMDGPVFISLNRPFAGLSASAMGTILNKAIELVCLNNQGFSAKCFRPTGATIAVESGIGADFVQATGRWKSTETFQKHYVHAKPPVEFTDVMFKSKDGRVWE